MKMLQAAIFLLIFLSVSCITTESQSVQKIDSKVEPEKVTLCQLKTDPATYNHKLVEVSAFVSKGFENFALFDPECSSSGSSVWLEYGGTAASGTIYCCGVTAERSRPKQLVVEDIPIILVEDEPFRTFSKLVQRPPDSTARATIIGRFFSGEKVETKKGVRWAGYGHFGCCSLLAIQQITSVNLQEQSDLDYRASADQPDSKVGCGYKFLKVSETEKDFIQVQQKAEIAPSQSNFNSPQQVAASTLAQLLNVNEKLIAEGLKQKRKAQGRFVYTWKPPTKDENYMVVVSRPYWLSFYAKDSKKTTWVVIAAYEISCG